MFNQDPNTNRDETQTADHLRGLSESRPNPSAAAKASGDMLKAKTRVMAGVIGVSGSQRTKVTETSELVSPMRSRGSPTVPCAHTQVC